MGDKEKKPNIIAPHGGYRTLKSYQNAEIIYDATVKFCDLFIDRRSRTRDQMVQAARSGKQNIAEGSMASGTSKKFELKLVSVARASPTHTSPGRPRGVAAGLPGFSAPARTANLGERQPPRTGGQETRL